MTTKTAPREGSLSSGREPFWRRSKPSLLADEELTGVPVPADEHFSPLNFFRVSAKTVVSIFVFFCILLIACWALFGVTILPVARVGGSTWAIKWSAWPQGQAPQNAIVATAGTSIQKDIFGRLAFLVGDNPQDSVQQIVAGPGGTISSDMSGNILWKGIPTGYKTNTPIVEYTLGESYLAYCIAGACGETGEYAEVESDRVIGEVLKEYSPPISIKDPPSYQAAGE